MKKIIIPIVALLISFGFSMVITRLITWKRRKAGTLTRKRRILVFVLVLLFVYFSSGFVYFSIYSHATDQALAYMNGSGTVKVSEVDTGYFFDGPGTEDAYIFYPGAKVDEKAYAELMVKLAERGVDCFLVKMPLHMAFLGRDKATKVMQTYDYKRWYIGGHSLGGAIAGAYIHEHPEGLSGAVMLAAYWDGDIPEGLPIVTITGTEDHVLNWDSFENGKKKWTSDVTWVSIKGGNHSQFGDYGFQKGDGEATISREEQLRQVVEAAMTMIQAQRDVV